MKQQRVQTGRLDQAAVAVADQLAAMLCPAEWPLLRPFVEQAAHTHLAPRPGSKAAIVTEAVQLAARFPNVV